MRAHDKEVAQTSRCGAPRLRRRSEPASSSSSNLARRTCQAKSAIPSLNLQDARGSLARPGPSGVRARTTPGAEARSLEPGYRGPCHGPFARPWRLLPASGWRCQSRRRQLAIALELLSLRGDELLDVVVAVEVPGAVLHDSDVRARFKASRRATQQVGAREVELARLDDVAEIFEWAVAPDRRIGWGCCVC